MIEMKTVAPQQQNGLLLTNLRERRIALGLTQRELSCFMKLSQSTLCGYETGRLIITPERLELYNLIISRCEAGELEYHLNQRQQYFLFRRCVTYSQAIQTRPVREKLGLTLQTASQLINITTSNLSKKERGKYTMTVSEYSKLMKFYRQEKLKKIFGGMMS